MAWSIGFNPRFIAFLFAIAVLVMAVISFAAFTVLNIIIGIILVLGGVYMFFAVWNDTRPHTMGYFITIIILFLCTIGALIGNIFAVGSGGLVNVGAIIVNIITLITLGFATFFGFRYWRASAAL